MKKQLSKLMCLLLVAAMLAQIVPSSVFATGNGVAQSGISEDSGFIDALADNPSETAEEALASAQILFEEESLREESVKHFRLDNGSYIAVQYASPVHYQDDGTWVDYDNTLRPVTALDGEEISCYRVDNGESTRVFAASADAEFLLAVQRGEYGLAFAPQSAPLDLSAPINADDHAQLVTSANVLDFASAGEVSDNPLLAQAQPEKLYSALEYENAINGATLRYENYGNTIKESIVISAPQSSYTYSFEIKTDGLTATMQDDGSINFEAPDGTVVYYIPAPYMIDAKNEYYNEAS